LCERPTRGAMQSVVIRPIMKTSERPVKSLYWVAQLDTLINEEANSLVKSVECDAHNWLREMKIFVGNLSGETTEDDLRQAFECFGRVRSVTIVMDAGEGK